MTLAATLAAATARIDNLHGWRAWLAAFAAGAVMVLAMPPFGFFPVLFICIPFMMLLSAAQKSAGRAFLAGWFFGAGYFVVGLHWFAVAFQTFFGHIPWFLPFAVIVIPGYIALYYGAAAALSWPFRSKRTHYALVFAFLLFWAEFLRGHYVTHFPWNIVGYGWVHVLPVMQITAIGGIYFLTLLTFFWAAAPLMNNNWRMIAALTFLMALGYGAVTLYNSPTQLTQHIIRIVQPNITQAEKEDLSNKDDIVMRHLRLTAQPADKKITYVVWPETAFDLFTPEDNDNLERLSLSLPDGAIALAGVNKRDADEKIRNSVIAVTPRGRIVARHDKFILAPWGEYIPYENIVARTPLYNAVAGLQSLAAGSGPSTIALGDLPSFSPVICFESTFAGQMTDKSARPAFLLFVTNDAWSMGSFGPYQHFGMARIRAIEEGLPIVRAANTGISATIDAQGRILTRLGLGQAGIIDAPLPAAGRPTLYARTGDGPLLALAGGISASLLIAGPLFRRKTA